MSDQEACPICGGKHKKIKESKNGTN